MTRVTIAGLAAQLKLSKASVSYALNGQPGVSDETRRRVLDLAADLGWHPSASARALSRSRTDAIGIVLRRDPSLLGTEPFYMSLLAGVESVLAETDQALMLRMVGTGVGQDLETYRRWSAQGRVDGVMLFDIGVNDPRPALLDQLGLDYVMHGNRDDIAPGHVLVYDPPAESALIVGHLARLGHRTVLHVTGPREFEHEGDRATSIEVEAFARGIGTVFAESDYSSEAGERLVVEHLAADPGITAVVTSNDVLALGAAAAFGRLGRDDVALVSWDDSFMCRLGSRPITALARFPEEQGRRATRMLLDALAGMPSEVTAAKPSELVVRATSIPAR
ncbi:LacI family DNA-binding transcriptional regulator [Leifsonia sp. PS1209]|uniref:LacI family DNA-binding transcriptional regulator n=1 Tax=Leifsonia sp. PS1209 TaxID=2724914 RepID=UPI001442D5BE|nr:LacI family DNA-binding transcriptional regulator [Leifsonia sp. PS1209]QIZ98088.1 LacI family transcriptional regulator [Leifsonia sp. PS1209]